MKKIICLILIMGLSQILFSETKIIVPKPFNPGKPLNSITSDFAPSFTADGKTMVFNSKRDGQKYTDIYISYYNKGSWSTPTSIRKINSKYSDETPFIAANGSYIIFASDRDGSFASRDRRGRTRVSFDLYMSKKSGNGWGRPFKLPGRVNTSFHERAPSVSLNGKMLFYTTWPFQNSKKSRIMVARFSEKGFGKGVIMPQPVNSGYYDMALIQDKEGFYFSSARPGGYGGWDIYFVAFKKGKLGTSAVNLGPIVNSKHNEVYYSKNNNTAYYCSNRPGGIGRFDIYRASFDIDKIYFKLDSAKLEKRSHKVLHEIIAFMKKHTYLRFEVIGHTDLHGTAIYNKRLSLQRAKVVRNFLIANGIKKSRLKFRGAGKSDPVVNKKGLRYARKNRRTEFRIIGIFY